MAYSFYHGYIKYVVASNAEASSKGKFTVLMTPLPGFPCRSYLFDSVLLFLFFYLGLEERIDDYETKHRVHFPIKKLLILQPQSMFIPPTLKTELLQNADVSKRILVASISFMRPFTYYVS